MSFYRISFVALATLFTIGMTSIASACCGGSYAPVVYVPPSPITYGCGASCGCGGCGAPTAAVVYAEPVAPAPVVYTHGCGCGATVDYAAPAVAPTPIAPSPIYVVNQGPDYTGPGVMVPYRTWSPYEAYQPVGPYPYLPGYGFHRHWHDWHGARRFYGGHAAYGISPYGHPFHTGPMQHRFYSHRWHG
jgi:hypothetical protein